MKLLVGVVLLCLAVVIYASPRVLGGKDAPDGKYPYMASIRTDGHLCGGSILNKRWILTAAHCLKGKEDYPFGVVVGTNLLKGGHGQSYVAEYSVVHEKYMNPTNKHDIALIRVSADIEFNDKVKPIGLPDKEFYDIDGYPVTLTGWGQTSMGPDLPNNLQEIESKVFDHAKCTEIFQDIVASQICALTKKGEGACFGDSGGPLVADGVQVGITNSVVPCGLGYPDIYVRVFSYVDWIAAEQAKFHDN